MVDWIRRCNPLYLELVNDAKETGRLKDLDKVHSELVPLLLDEKEIESIQLLKRGRIRIWTSFVERKINKFERTLKPPQIFDDRVFDELQSIKQTHSEVELKIQNGDLSAIEDCKRILEMINRSSEYADRLRSRSAFDAVKEIFKTGIIITVLFAGGMYGLIRVYPNIRRTHLMMLINIIMVLISLLLVTFAFP